MGLKPISDANEVGLDSKPLTWKPFSSIFDSSKRVVSDGIKHGKSQVRKGFDRLADHPNQCGGNDLRYTGSEYDARPYALID
jgi:hypothetical protein